MDKKDLQKKLNKPYSTDNWQEVVQFVFPNVQILNPPMLIPIDNDKVESFRQLGNVQLHDGKALALFELKLKENVNIIRNRVELNNIVSQYIDQDQTHGVLSIFEQGGEDYRFTFSARASEFDEEAGDFKTTKTDTKRFTYVLGKNESCKTPAQRFYELSENKNKAEIKDIENAFSVEKLSKAFFKEYKDQYTAFVNYMMQTPGIFKAIYSEDDKAIRDFVKILLGRIIFIKFVQKKGWMGVEASSKKWIDGDYRFLENGFANFKHQDLFYSTFLEPLFDALDEPNRPNDIFTVTNTRIPYLSGGLFELEDKKTKNINFPANYFAGLFEFLDRYNFTIDENDTNDHEVGIDPEMLGHIFENLLEDNKDKGAFYTPKEIVRYMCQESLKEYLKTSLENNKQWPTDETEAAAFEQALHNFVTKKEAGGIIEFEETIARALKEVKICDPAIGSGAFPMGLLNEIFQLVHKLHDANGDKVERVWGLEGWQPNKVKQNIIKHSIYGVDIEKGAVDVARLRFWLSLIVDEQEPKALPHLDYKIVVGNSLVSKIDDTIIDIDWSLVTENAIETDLFGKPKPKQFNAFETETIDKQKLLLQQIAEKQTEVFDPISDEAKLSLEIRNLKIDLLCEQLRLMIVRQNIQKEPRVEDYLNKNKAKFAIDQANYFEALGWKQQIEKLQKLRKDPNGMLHFFDWKLDFPEIMNEDITAKFGKKPGFDIVIANPPYIGEKGNKEIFQDVKKTHLNEFYIKKMDYFYFFFHKALNISNVNSNFVFITTNYYVTATGAKMLRKDIFNRASILKLINFGEAKIFQSALGQHNLITILSRKNTPQNTKIISTNRKGIINNSEYIKIFEGIDNETKYQTLSKEKLYYGDDKYIRIELSDTLKMDNTIQNILDKIKSKGKPLGDICDVNQGLRTGADKVSPKHLSLYNESANYDKGDGIFILKETEVNNLNLNEFEKSKIKKLYKNSDIKKYFAKSKTPYVIIDIFWPNDRNLDIKKIPNIINHLSKFKEILEGRKENANGLDKAIANGKYYFGSVRRKLDFSLPKIISPQRSRINTFGYTTNEWFASADVYYITNSDGNINLKYILGLLNSKLYFLWLYNKGKRKGEMLELYQKPLTEIPIFIYNSKRIIELVDNILELKEKGKNSSDLEQQIDNLVYKLYELTYDEVLVVEPEFSVRMSREEYEGLKVE
jgi:adenine-specific DNA-methyltransferase